jgi:hypothetical protein
MRKVYDNENDGDLKYSLEHSTQVSLRGTVFVIHPACEISVPVILMKYDSATKFPLSYWERINFLQLQFAKF